MAKAYDDIPPVRPMTLGEKRVRLSFNPGGNPQVDDIKARVAALIDLCDAMKLAAQKQFSGDEAARCCSLAMTAFEDGAMWAVKAATG
jgi:hypothetical protein